MRVEFAEAICLDERQELSLEQLADLSGLSESELRQLMEYEALMPVDPQAAALTFKATCLVSARTACRLRNDFDLDTGELALVLSLLDRIRDLESQLREVEVRLPRRLRSGS